ncbi:PLP-dependent transferase [Hortaea werneckii]|nr:PLP-dependent transferase [Hortaea werneckii]
MITFKTLSLSVSSVGWVRVVRTSSNVPVTATTVVMTQFWLTCLYGVLPEQPQQSKSFRADGHDLQLIGLRELTIQDESRDLVSWKAWRCDNRRESLGGRCRPKHTPRSPVYQPHTFDLRTKGFWPMPMKRVRMKGSVSHLVVRKHGFILKIRSSLERTRTVISSADSKPTPSHVASSLVRRLPDHTIHGLGKVIDVLRIQTRHTNTSVLGHVDMELLAELLHLLLVEAGEGEHANLVGDVIPGAGSAHLLELGAELLAHLDDAAGHGAEVLLPLREQLLVVEDRAGYPGAVGGRVGDLGALQDGQLAAHAVLRVGLRDHELEALLDKVVDGPGVASQRAGGKALVCAVEEGELFLLLHHLGDLLPLILRWVDTGRVVGAGVK